MTEPAGDQAGVRREEAKIRTGFLYGIGVAMVVALALGLWVTRQALLLVFAGVLLAVLLHGLSNWIEHRTRLPRLAVLPLIIVGLTAAFVLMAISAGPTLEQQLEQLFNSLREVVANLTQRVRTAASEDARLRDFNLQQVLDFLPNPWGVASGATAAVYGVLGAVSSFFIILFVGVYLAADPASYMRLGVRLAPPGQADNARDLLIDTGKVLRGWLVGQFCSMAAIGVLVYIGLLILGVPLAFVLALFAALMGFIPYLGPILGAIPMLAVAGGQGMDQFISVFILYVVVQAVESNLLTPMIQSRAVHMPPAIVIASQLFMGALFGILGLALATPMVAAASVPLSHYFPKRNVDLDDDL
jgi:predicted PurR-regulated permease PerM